MLSLVGTEIASIAFQPARKHVDAAVLVDMASASSTLYPICIACCTHGQHDAQECETPTDIYHPAPVVPCMAFMLHARYNRQAAALCEHS
eukprot:184692-Amphidinium_carterae.1